MLDCHGSVSHPTHPTHAKQGMMILIVEDERISRQALASLLDSSGYHSEACESAEEALNRIGMGEGPRFALVDVDLPGMSGLELISRLEQLSPETVSVL